MTDARILAILLTLCVGIFGGTSSGARGACEGLRNRSEKFRQFHRLVFAATSRGAFSFLRPDKTRFSRTLETISIERRRAD